MIYFGFMLGWGACTLFFTALLIRRASEWEQKVLGSDAYARLCRSCARRRLHNPWNALLALRKVAE